MELRRADRLIGPVRIRYFENVREVTATDAARGFSALLTAVERDGETFLITPAGRVVARIEPAVGASGKVVKALLRRHRLDAEWPAELAAVRELLADQQRAWPD